MRKINIFITLLLLSVINIFAQNDDYKLVWADEFESNVINTDNWNYEIGGNGWGNQELQYYTDRADNSFIRDGKLVIKAKKEEYENRNFTSARLTTKGKAFVKYGKIEARIKLPSGKGTWPAFWMMPQNSEYGAWPRSGEIDIMEHVGSKPDMISFAVHTRNQNGSSGNNWHNQITLGNVEHEFHTYSIEWLEDRIVFNVDDVKQVTYWNNLLGDYKFWPFDKEFYVILNLALGGLMGGPIDATIFDSDIEMEVDYVRIYQKNTSGINEDANSQEIITVNKDTDTIEVKDISENSTLKLYSINGNLLAENIEKGSTERVIETNSFQSGVYILAINQEGKTTSHKVIL